MGAFIGPLGGLIEATQWEEQQSVSTGAAPSFFTGLDGARTALVQPVIGRVMREWDVSMSGARPEQAAAFQALAMGAMGAGPFRFVDPLAQVTNVLTLRQSLLDPETLPRKVMPSRTVVPGLGSMPAALVDANTVAYLFGETPVVPGTPVTVSAWAVSPAPVNITAQCLTTDGSWTGNRSRTQSGLTSGGWLSVTVTPNDSAAKVSLRIEASAPVVVACPSISWTRQPMTWSPGRGANAVVVHGLKESFSRASPHAGGPRRLDYSATVTEVGLGA